MFRMITFKKGINVLGHLKTKNKIKWKNQTTTGRQISKEKNRGLDQVDNESIPQV